MLGMVKANGEHASFASKTNSKTGAGFTSTVSMRSSLQPRSSIASNVTL